MYSFTCPNFGAGNPQKTERREQMSEAVNIGPVSEDWPDRAEHLTEGFSVVVDLKV